MRPQPSLQRALGAIVLSLTLVAASIAAPSVATAAPPVAPTAAVAAAAAVTPEQQVALLINKQRKAKKLPELKVYTVMQSAAETWGTHLKNKGVFAHSSSSWRSSKISASGWASSGENLAWGYTSASAAVAAWMKSSGHKANILGKSYRGMGIGYVKGGKHRHYWVVIFGVPKPSMTKGTKPVVSGTAKVGSTLVAKTSKWPSGTKLTWTWTRNGVVIPTAKSSSYKVVAADKGRKLQVKVSASNSKYFPTSISSRLTGAIAV